MYIFRRKPFLMLCLQYLCHLYRCQEVIKLGVILPFEGKAFWTLPRVKSGITLAIDTIMNRSDLLQGHRLEVNYADSKCSETHGPLAAIDMYYHKQADVFIGPGCDYALAPIARFSRLWNIPVITAGGFVHAFSDKTSEFHQLTRIGGSYSDLGKALSVILRTFDWTQVGLIYNEHQGNRGHLGKTDCWFVMEGMYYRLRKIIGEKYPGKDVWYKSFDEHAQPEENLDTISSILKEAQTNTRIIVMCASPYSVREVMIKAAEMNFDYGEYVFINIDLFNSMESLERPWYNASDTPERNQLARKAYEALMTVTLRKPNNLEYNKFLEEVKRRAKQEYGTPASGEINSYIVGAFHDAVILYAFAANETLEAGFNVTDGREVTKRMWNRTFKGITGNVSIDRNGDRNADYSILDLNPTTGKFEVVGNYYGSIGAYKPVQGKTIHWAGGREEPPPDTPPCGFDGSGCPAQEPFPAYGTVLIVFGVLFVIIVIVSVFVCRHYRLKAQQAYAKWTANRDEVMFRDP